MNDLIHLSKRKVLKGLQVGMTVTLKTDTLQLCVRFHKVPIKTMEQCLKLVQS